jgi:hypothetical protein
MEMFSGRDNRRGAVFGDDGGAGIFLAGAKIVSRENLRIEFFPIE